jgi:hypothetical protein
MGRTWQVWRKTSVFGRICCVATKNIAHANYAWLPEILVFFIIIKVLFEFSVGFFSIVDFLVKTKP